MQKSTTFVKKDLKINISKIKIYPKVRNHCHSTGEYWGDENSICHLKYSVPKKSSSIFK